MAPVTSSKAHKKALKALQAREQLASKWLIRLSLFLALLGWVYDEYADDRAKERTGKGHGGYTGGAGKQVMIYVGVAMAVGKLATRWYFMQERRTLEEQLLADDAKETEEPRTVRRLRQKER